MRHPVETAKKPLNCGVVRTSRCRRLSQVVIRSNWMRMNPGQGVPRGPTAAELLCQVAVTGEAASYSPRRTICRENPDTWQECCNVNLMTTHFKNLTLV